MKKSILYLSSLIFFINIQTTCMQRLARTLRYAPHTTCRLAILKQQHSEVPKRNLIYTVKDWEYCGHWGHAMRMIDVSQSLQAFSAKEFARIEFDKWLIWNKQNIPTIPVIDGKKLFCFACLHYPSPCITPLPAHHFTRHLLLVTNKDLQQIVYAAEQGASIDCAGEIELKKSQKGALEFHCHPYKAPENSLAGKLFLKQEKKVLRSTSLLRYLRRPIQVTFSTIQVNKA